MAGMDTGQLVARLKGLKPEMLSRYKVKEVGLFGSFVRGEHTAASDIDILVDFNEDADLFDWMALALFLEKELQRKVDVVPKNALRTELRGPVLQEIVPL